MGLDKNREIKVGIITGMGLSRSGILEIENMKEERVDTPFGSVSSSIMTGEIGKVPIALLARCGRNHTILPGQVNYRANIWALYKLGCTHVIATAACGSLRKSIKPGDLVVIDQFVDQTTTRSSTFYDGSTKELIGACYLPMSEPFCSETNQLITKVILELKNVNFHKQGTVVIIDGPRFTTWAESRLFQLWGCDLVNMTTAPEAQLAKEIGLCYSCIGLATDYDSWYVGKRIEADKMDKVFDRNIETMVRLFQALVPKIFERDWSETLRRNCELVEANTILPASDTTLKKISFASNKKLSTKRTKMGKIPGKNQQAGHDASVKSPPPQNNSNEQSGLPPSESEADVPMADLISLGGKSLYASELPAEGESKVEEGESKVEEGESKVEEGESKGEKTESKAKDGKSKAEEVESKGEKTESKAEEVELLKAEEGESKDEVESKTEDRKSKAEVNEFKIEEIESKAEEGESKTEEGESKTEEGESKAEEFEVVKDPSDEGLFPLEKQLSSQEGSEQPEDQQKSEQLADQEKCYEHQTEQQQKQNENDKKMDTEQEENKTEKNHKEENSEKNHKEKKDGTRYHGPFRGEGGESNDNYVTETTVNEMLKEKPEPLSNGNKKKGKQAHEKKRGKQSQDKKKGKQVKEIPIVRLSQTMESVQKMLSENAVLKETLENVRKVLSSEDKKMSASQVLEQVAKVVSDNALRPLSEANVEKIMSDSSLIGNEKDEAYIPSPQEVFAAVEEMISDKVGKLSKNLTPQSEIGSQSLNDGIKS